ncbi:unnamed protein product [Penicillium salamii]|nr:unnamed protein product [Penicillium salamii]
MEHEATGKCEAVAAIRGTEIGQGAKALADLGKVAAAVGGRRASLASPAETDLLTGCVFGAIPPFSFHPDLRLVVDPALFERYPEIAFNAGLLERSVILNTEDYRVLCAADVVKITQ